MSDSLSVVLLNAEGDQVSSRSFFSLARPPINAPYSPIPVKQFNASLIADGEQGGQQAATHLYHRVKASLARSGTPTSSSLVVYPVA